MDIQKAREKFAEINLKEGFYTEEELSITDLGVFEYTAAEQDWEKWWECLIYYVEPMQQAQKVAVPEGFVLINKESLAFHARSIRMFNSGEHYKEEVEEHVCSIEAMIEAVEKNDE